MWVFGIVWRLNNKYQIPFVYRWSRLSQSPAVDECVRDAKEGGGDRQMQKIAAKFLQREINCAQRNETRQLYILQTKPENHLVAKTFKKLEYSYLVPIPILVPRAPFFFLCAGTWPKEIEDLGTRMTYPGNPGTVMFEKAYRKSGSCVHTRITPARILVLKNNRYSFLILPSS